MIKFRRIRLSYLMWNIKFSKTNLGPVNIYFSFFTERDIQILKTIVSTSLIYRKYDFLVISINFKITPGCISIY